MRLADTNAPVSVHRQDAPQRAACRDWLEALINGPESFGVSELVPSGFLHVVKIAIETGCERITTGRDYSRLEGLRWRHPLQ